MCCCPIAKIAAIIGKFDYIVCLSVRWMTGYDRGDVV